MGGRLAKCAAPCGGKGLEIHATADTMRVSVAFGYRLEEREHQVVVRFIDSAFNPMRCVAEDRAEQSK